MACYYFCVALSVNVEIVRSILSCKTHNCVDCVLSIYGSFLVFLGDMRQS